MLASSGSLAEALDIAEREICTRILENRQDVMWMHGATIAGPSGAALICGDSGAGKTTLALALAPRGFEVWSDDLSMMDPRAGETRALPRCFHLDDRSRRLLRQAGLQLPGGRHGFVTPADLGVDPTPASNIRLIVFLLPGAESSDPPRLEQLSHAETVVELLRNYVGIGDYTPQESLKALGWLVSGAACYRLSRGGIVETAGLVAGLLAPPGKPRS
jgi:hypothetical protein